MKSNVSFLPSIKEGSSDRGKKPATKGKSNDRENGNKKQRSGPTLATPQRAGKNNKAHPQVGEVPQGAMNEAFVVHTSDQSEPLTFDASIFKASDRSFGGLTSPTRQILSKHPRERSEDELWVLREMIERLKCFDKYPCKVKNKMAAILFYEPLGHARVIIQQGQLGSACYFIVSGQVEVFLKTVDKETGRKYTKMIGELTEGESFGELALMHNLTRATTIITKGSVELLRVDKDDFESVLRATHDREWLDRLNALSWIPVFKDFTKKEKTICTNFCRITEYSHNTIIRGNINDAPENISFVLSGQCLLIREIDLVREVYGYGRIVYHLPTAGCKKRFQVRTPKSKRRTSVIGTLPERHLWTAGVLRRGDYFSVGEDFTDTYLLANGRVEVLVIPRLQLQKMRGASLLATMREDLDATIPSNSTLFKNFFTERDWEKYKSGITRDVLKRRTRRIPTSVSDVPMCITAEKNATFIGYACNNNNCCPLADPVSAC